MKNKKQEREYVISQAKKVGLFIAGCSVALLISYLILKW